MLMANLPEVEKELLAVRRELHANPELSGQEKNTREIILRFLKDLPLEVKIAKNSMGLVAVLKSGGQGAIALRADMDALPMEEDSGLSFSSQNAGACHSCGHDIHTTVLLGCAKVLAENKDKLSSDVVFIFQPAEETLGGAQSLLSEGLLGGLDIEKIFALHTWPDIPAGCIGVKKDAFMASSDSVDIEITGQAGHGAHPHRSIDAIVIAAHVISALQTVVAREIAPVDSAVLSFGKISGGQARNIIAGKVLLEGTARSLTAETRKILAESIERITVNTAKALKGNAKINYQAGTPPLQNNGNLVEEVIAAANQTLGGDKIHYLTMPSMGSEDFSFYLEKYPGCLFRLGTGNDQPASKLALHNPQIIFDEASIITGVKVLTQLVLNNKK